MPPKFNDLQLRQRQREQKEADGKKKRKLKNRARAVRKRLTGESSSDSESEEEEPTRHDDDDSDEDLLHKDLHAYHEPDADDDSDDDGTQMKAVAIDSFMNRETPEELFVKFDADGSGSIDLEEFRDMIPQLGLDFTEAKMRKYFRMCDTDGTGEIDV
jgi:hypothetical protein